MRCIIAMAAVLLFPVLTLGATMRLTVNGASSILAQPGDTLPVSLTVDTPVQIAAFDGRFRASRSYVLSVSEYSLAPAFPWSEIELPPNGPLNPVSVGIIGSLAFVNLGPGTVPLATFNLVIASTWDRVPVQLTVINPLLSDGAGAPVPLDVAPLNIIPEPTSLMMLGTAVVCLRGRRSERGIP